MNRVGDAIEFSIGSLSSDTSVFDFVCANLTLDVILPILPLLFEKAGKTLVLSGILTEQEGEIVSALTKLGVRDVEIARAGEWIRVVVRA
jgi:ribosomal protein L11 methylase PrmA